MPKAEPRGRRFDLYVYGGVSKDVPGLDQGSYRRIDLTPEVERIVTGSAIREGIVNVSGRGSTLAVTTIEFEPGGVADLQRALEWIAPANSGLDRA